VGYQWLVLAILTLHFGYIAYLILGGFLAWRWPKAIWPHLAATVWAVLIVVQWVDCPLTWAEGWARGRAGQTVPTTGFVDRYLTNVIYPARYLNEVRLAVAIVVAVSWAVAWRRWRARRMARAAAEVGAVGAEAVAAPGAAGPRDAT
jgi:uncharacterized protein DUF2784